MANNKKRMTKIDAAIYDVELRLNNVKEKIQLLIRERDVLQEVVKTLNIIKENEDYD